MWPYDPAPTRGLLAELTGESTMLAEQIDRLDDRRADLHARLRRLRQQIRRLELELEPRPPSPGEEQQP